jgi:hypothetical protein
MKHPSLLAIGLALIAGGIAVRIKGALMDHDAVAVAGTITLIAGLVTLFYRAGKSAPFDWSAEVKRFHDAISAELIADAPPDALALVLELRPMTHEGKPGFMARIPPDHPGGDPGTVTDTLRQRLDGLADFHLAHKHPLTPLTITATKLPTSDWSFSIESAG